VQSCSFSATTPSTVASPKAQHPAKSKRKRDEYNLDNVSAHVLLSLRSSNCNCRLALRSLSKTNQELLQLTRKSLAPPEPYARRTAKGSAKRSLEPVSLEHVKDVSGSK
jgi:hypothetical protein